MARMGMNVEEVERLGNDLKSKGAQIEGLVGQIDGIVHQLCTIWHGSDADSFVNNAWPDHRAKLRTAGEQVSRLGQLALTNATAQRDVSAAPGGVSFATAGSYLGATLAATAPFAALSAVGPAFRQANEKTQVPGSALGYLQKLSKSMSVAGNADSSWAKIFNYGAEHGVGGLLPEAQMLSHASTFEHVAGVLDAAGKPLTVLNELVDGFTIGQSLADGHYVDAAIAAGDATATIVKQVPGGYWPGVAIASWTEVASAAKGVDWSPQGMKELQGVSLGEWGSALGDAAKQLPMKAFNIFAP